MNIDRVSIQNHEYQIYHCDDPISPGDQIVIDKNKLILVKSFKFQSASTFHMFCRENDFKIIKNYFSRYY